MATVTLAFYAQFTASKAGVQSLTVTWDIDRITRADGTRSALQTGAATNITIGRRGLYGYYQTGCDLDLYDYVAMAITSDTSVDLKEVPALWTYWVADAQDAFITTLAANPVGSVTGNVGGNVAGSVGSVTAPVTAGTVSDKTGYALTGAYDAAKTAAAPGASMVAGSLASQAQTDVQSAMTSQGYTTARAGYLDYLDAAISSRLAASGYTAPLTALQVAAAVLDVLASDHNSSNTIGAKINAAGSATDPLTTALNTYASGTYGALLNGLNPQRVTLVSPVSQSGTAEVVRGMDYSATDGLALDWTFSANPDLTGATVALYIYSGSSLEATWTPTVVTPTAGAGKVRVQPTNAQTGALRETTYAFAIWATLTSTRKVQLYAGTLVVLPELRP